MGTYFDESEEQSEVTELPPRRRRLKLVGAIAMIALLFLATVGVWLQRPPPRWKPIGQNAVQGLLPPFKILREEKRPPAQELKLILSRELAAWPMINRAYFADVEYLGGDRRVACLFLAKQNLSETDKDRLIQRLLDDVRPVLFRDRLSLDVFAIQSESVVPEGVKSFYPPG